MKLAILDDYQEVALRMADWSPLAGRVDISVFSDTLDDEDRCVERLQDYEILCLMRERTPMPGALLRRLPKLRHVFTSGMRNRSIDLAVCDELGIVVTGSPTLDHPTAELTIGLMLALARQIPLEDRALHAGLWAQTVGVSLRENTLGVLGLGRMGSQVARLAQAFGMRVIAWSANLKRQRCEALGVECATSKEALLREADFVSVHLMLGERSRGLIGAPEFAAMKSSAYLINTGRAEIVDQDALVTALREGQIAGAGIDVYAVEPLPADHPLRALDRAILTPHQGYVVRENYRLFYETAVFNILAWLNGKVVNRVTGHTGPETHPAVQVDATNER